MKTLTVTTLLCLLLGTTLLAQESGPKQYICPMYCTDSISLNPSSICSVCNMKFEDKAVVENPTDHKLIWPDKAYSLMQKDSSIFILDVRSKAEFRDVGHIAKAVLIPIKELEDRLSELTPAKSKTIIAYCSHGIRSARAATLLQKKGFTVLSLVGGTTKWTRDKLPLAHD
jgi:rhodanese-related sulfurtransferase